MLQSISLAEQFLYFYSLAGPTALNCTGSTLALATSLNLVQTIFHQNEPRKLFRRLRTGLASALARFLLTPEAVVFSQKTASTTRRCWFRELLKRHRKIKR